MTNKPKRWPRRAGILMLAFFVLPMNVVAALHAWRFTHFTDSKAGRHEHAERLNFGEKARIALTGIPNPRPANQTLPSLPYKTVILQSNVKLACWYMAANGKAQGTAILFHGYGGEKSGMLPKAMILHNLGYNVFLPDFMGSGGSEGLQTTIGFREAENVKTCYDYIKGTGERSIVMLGTSMGAAAILKYLNDGGEQPAGIIIECPFGMMYQTVCARFRMVGAPQFPMAGLLVFWGGLEHGFWAFNL